MAEPTWSIRRNKRKTPSASSSTRKRVRISDDVDIRPATSSSTKKRRPQSTLTQIQFVTTPQASFEGDSELLEISTVDDGQDVTPRPSRRKRKRDSTLTQMDWLNRPLQDEAQLEDEMLPQSPVVEELRPKMSQADGTVEKLQTPQKQTYSRKRAVLQDKTSSKIRSGDPVLETGSPSISEATNVGTGRRRSGRLASRKSVQLDSPADKTAFATSRHEIRDISPKKPSPVPMPRLEIADTFDFGDTQGGFAENRPEVPQTPTERIIPSSQSPESIHTLTKSVNKLQQLQSPSKSMRTPLAERSVNIPSSKRSGLKSALRIRSPVKSPAPRARTLRAPNKELLPRATRVEYPQDDIYSLQPTSTPRRRSKTPMLAETKATVQQQQSIESLEIPATSSSHNPSDVSMPSSPPTREVDTQYSLPAVNDLIKAGHRKRTENTSAEISSTALEKEDSSPAKVHFQEIADNISESHVEDEMLLDREIQVAGGARMQNADDKDSDFGSPVANDTQFNHALLQRISSPIIDGPRQESPAPALHHAKSFQTLPRPDERAAKNGNSSSELSSSLPTPQLVPRSSPTKLASEAGLSEIPTEPASPPTFGRRTDTSGSMRQILLNDELPSSPPSMLPPPFRGATQRSIHPASMLRPSQMSTQEPTQGFLSSSGLRHTQLQRDNHQSDAAKIVTIKDSSPVRERFSQIPMYTSQGVKKEVIEDSDEDIDDLDLDLDLDPVSGPQHNSARKPVAQLISRTESSLKSIHPSNPIADVNQLDRDHVLSSSPLLQAQDVGQIRKQTKKTRQNGARSLRRSPSTAVKNARTPKTKPMSPRQQEIHDQILDELTSSSSSSPPMSALRGRRDTLPGFDNDTQSDFTQGGHVSAAYIHRMRDEGLLPDWFTPKPYQVKQRGRKGVEDDDEL